MSGLALKNIVEEIKEIYHTGLVEKMAMDNG